MANYYAALIAAWNSATQPPTGVTGTGLLAGDTTLQKLAKVNAWTVTGSIPTSVVTTGLAIQQCIVPADFAALTAAQQATALQICAMPQVLGGSASFIGTVLGTIFNGKTSTINNFIALATATVQPWYTANGYPTPISLNDLIDAGNLT
jgi:hypothetical protein